MSQIKNFCNKKKSNCNSKWKDDSLDLSVDIDGKNALRKLRISKKCKEIEDYEERLRNMKNKLNPSYTWAKTHTKTNFLNLKNKSEWKEKDIPPNLNTTRLNDISHLRQPNTLIQSVEFHPSKTDLMLTAGLDKGLRLFKLEDETRKMLQTISFEDMPLLRAAFTPWCRVLCTGRRKYFYIYDMIKAFAQRITIQGISSTNVKSFESFAIQHNSHDPLAAFLGNDGCIPLISLKSNLVTGQIQSNGTVRCAAFSSAPYGLWTLGGDCVLHNWDLRMQRCIERVVDQGTTKPTSLACSKDGRWLATGSDMGFVNIYSCNKFLSSDCVHNSMGPCTTTSIPTEKVFTNLTTSVDTIEFSSDSKILVIASRLKRDSLRVIHLPTKKMFSNWPTAKTPLGRVHSVAFSPVKNDLAIGNDKGTVLIYRLHH
jgi:U3 small nucleolar RNA-associated protein 18